LGRWTGGGWPKRKGAIFRLKAGRGPRWWAEPKAGGSVLPPRVGETVSGEGGPGGKGAVWAGDSITTTQNRRGAGHLGFDLGRGGVSAPRAPKGAKGRRLRRKKRTPAGRAGVPGFRVGRGGGRGRGAQNPPSRGPGGRPGAGFGGRGGDRGPGICSGWGAEGCWPRVVGGQPGKNVAFRAGRGAGPGSQGGGGGPWSWPGSSWGTSRGNGGGGGEGVRGAGGGSGGPGGFSGFPVAPPRRTLANRGAGRFGGKKPATGGGPRGLLGFSGTGGTPPFVKGLANRGGGTRATRGFRAGGGRVSGATFPNPKTKTVYGPGGGWNNHFGKKIRGGCSPGGLGTVPNSGGPTKSPGGGIPPPHPPPPPPGGGGKKPP